MKTRLLAPTLLGIAVPILLPLSAPAQDAPDAAAVEDAMTKFTTPGPEHKLMRSLAGTWKAESTYWMTPGAAPTITSVGESKCRFILGGRYLSENFSTDFPGVGPFHGRGTLGYDRVANEFVHTWIDTMGTGMMISRGKATDDGKAIEMHSTFKDPVTMQDLQYRLVYQLANKKARTLEMFVTYPGKDEYRLMQVAYTKVAGPKGKTDGEAAQAPTTDADDEAEAVKDADVPKKD